MIGNILTGAGLEADVTFKETRFLKPPRSTYAIYNDDKTFRGPDDFIALVRHDVTILLFEYAPDPDIEQAIERQLDQAGLQYVKQDRYWINDEHVFQVIYNFSYTEKRGVFK